MYFLLLHRAGCLVDVRCTTRRVGLEAAEKMTMDRQGKMRYTWLIGLAVAVQAQLLYPADLLLPDAQVVADRLEMGFAQGKYKQGGADQQKPFKMPTWDDDTAAQPIQKGPLVSDMLAIDRSCRIFADLTRSQEKMVWVLFGLVYD